MDTSAHPDGPRDPAAGARRPLAALVAVVVLIALPACAAQPSEDASPAGPAGASVPPWFGGAAGAPSSADASKWPAPGQPDAGAGPGPAADGGGAEAGPDLDKAFEAARAKLAARVAQKKIPGGAIAVLSGKKTWAVGIGVRSIASGAPVLPATPFALASVTKTVTALALLALVDQGKAAIDLPATGLVPDLKVGGTWSASSVKIRHLLAHTSGYPNYADGTYDPFADPSADAIAKYLSQYGGLSLEFAPGSSWAYSNFGYAIAGLAVERAAQQPYAQAVRARVLDPAGMTSATYSWAEADAKGAANPHTMQGATVVEGQNFSSPFYEPFGGLFASAVDLVRLGGAIAQGAVVKPATLAAMLTQEPNAQMGLGAFVIPSPDGTIGWHGGSQVGIESAFFFAPGSGFSCAAIVNGDWDVGVAPSACNDAIEGFLGFKPLP